MEKRLHVWDDICSLPDIGIFDLDRERTLNLLSVFWPSTGVGSASAYTIPDAVLGPGTIEHETLKFCWNICFG